MSNYYYKKSLRRKVIRWEKAHKGFLIFGLIALVLISLAAGYFIKQLSTTNSNPTKIDPVKLGVYSGSPQKQYVNEVMQFTSTNEWQYLREASLPPNKYVFANHINGITQYELKFYLNDVPEEPVNYIVPITIKENKLQPGLISQRCGDNLKKGNGSAPTAYGRVKYLCDLINSNEKIAIGVQGGSYGVPLYDSKGNLHTVGIVFTDHSPGYKPEVFLEIINSFKLR